MSAGAIHSLQGQRFGWYYCQEVLVRLLCWYGCQVLVLLPGGWYYCQVNGLSW